MKPRKVSTNIFDVLSMVSCADDYGHNRQIVMHFLWELAGKKVSDEEIEAFIQKSFLTDKARGQGYSEEDAERSREAIFEWRTRHLDLREETE